MEASERIGFLSTLLPFAAIIFIIAIGVVLLTQQFRKNLYRQKLEQEELKNQHQMELLRSSIAVQEQERKRIASDMHDELGATLSITRMHLLQAERLCGNTNAQLLADLQNIRNLTESSLSNMRRISHELMPPQLERFGLVKTLESIATQINAGTQVTLTINIQNQLPEMTWPLKLAFYRIFMELINNSLKHSGATQLNIQLDYNNNQLLGYYTDNGKGINLNLTVEGLGQKSMQGRATSLGGTMSSGNLAEGGYYANISIPFAT